MTLDQGRTAMSAVCKHDLPSKTGDAEDKQELPDITVQ